MNPSAEFIGSRQAARLLGVAPLTLRVRILKGELASFEHPLDARWRLVRRADLEALQKIRPARNTRPTELSVA